jgi:hypothetical protein
MAFTRTYLASGRTHPCHIGGGRGREQTADQAKSAAAAYEAAFAMTIPSGGRRGQPCAARGAGGDESAWARTLRRSRPPRPKYGEMWAQDAAAMYGYAGSSAVAAAVTSFNSPPEPRTSEGRWVARRKGRVAPLSSELWQCTAYPEIPEATWAQPLIRDELS